MPLSILAALLLSNPALADNACQPGAFAGFIQDLGSILGSAAASIEDHLFGEPAPSSITREADEDEWKALREEVASFEDHPMRGLVRKTSNDRKLARGEILTATEKRPDGMIEEMTVGIVDVPYDQFVQAIRPADWGVKLFGYVDGEVTVAEVDDQGRPIRQHERMILETPFSEHLNWADGAYAGFKHLDMTKTEEITYGEGEATVRWRVYNSDNDTVQQDIGYVRFEAVDSGTKVTFHSAHKYTDSYLAPFTGLLEGVGDELTADGLSDYFTGVIEHYREQARP